MWTVPRRPRIRLLGSVDHASLRRCPSLWPAVRIDEACLFVQVAENSLNDHGILNTGDDAECPAATTAGLHVDIEHARQTLGPGHSGASFVRGALGQFVGCGLPMVNLRRDTQLTGKGRAEPFVRGDGEGVAATVIDPL